jgi:hypothetical protein
MVLAKSRSETIVRKTESQKQSPGREQYTVSQSLQRARAIQRLAIPKHPRSIKTVVYASIERPEKFEVRGVHFGFRRRPLTLSCRRNIPIKVEEQRI